MELGKDSLILVEPLDEEATDDLRGTGGGVDAKLIEGLLGSIWEDSSEQLLKEEEAEGPVYNCKSCGIMISASVFWSVYEIFGSHCMSLILRAPCHEAFSFHIVQSNVTVHSFLFISGAGNRSSLSGLSLK